MQRMMRYKGKYVARVTIDFNIKPDDCMRPFDVMKKMLVNEVTPALYALLMQDFMDDRMGTLEVEQMQAELWKENEDNE